VKVLPADHLAQAARLIAAARSTKKAEQRVLYAGHARLEIECAARQLESLRTRLRQLQEELPKPAKDG
jgi:hypothetical protein